MAQKKSNNQPSAKRLSKRVSKINQKSVNQKAKDNYKYAK